MREKLELLQQKRSESEQGGGSDRIETQHKKGKMTARERLDVLLDPGTFVELEVVLRDDELPDAGEREALRLLDTLGIPASSLLSGAYIDLLAGATAPD